MGLRGNSDWWPWAVYVVLARRRSRGKSKRCSQAPYTCSHKARILLYSAEAADSASRKHRACINEEGAASGAVVSARLAPFSGSGRVFSIALKLQPKPTQHCCTCRVASTLAIDSQPFARGARLLDWGAWRGDQDARDRTSEVDVPRRQQSPRAKPDSHHSSSANHPLRSRAS